MEVLIGIILGIVVIVVLRIALGNEVSKEEISKMTDEEKANISAFPKDGGAG